MANTEKLTLKLTRKRANDSATYGVLEIDSVGFKCHTMELPECDYYKPRGAMYYGCCLPVGSYECMTEYNVRTGTWPRFKKVRGYPYPRFDSQALSISDLTAGGIILFNESETDFSVKDNLQVLRGFSLALTEAFVMAGIKQRGCNIVLEIVQADDFEKESKSFNEPSKNFNFL